VNKVVRKIFGSFEERDQRTRASRLLQFRGSCWDDQNKQDDMNGHVAHIREKRDVHVLGVNMAENTHLQAYE
jgi:hypothetical protein